MTHIYAAIASRAFEILTYDKSVKRNIIHRISVLNKLHYKIIIRKKQK